MVAMIALQADGAGSKGTSHRDDAQGAGAEA